MAGTENGHVQDMKRCLVFFSDPEDRAGLLTAVSPSEGIVKS